MTVVNKTDSVSLGDTPPPSSTVPDSTTQAVADLGELAFLAAAYQSLVAEYGANSSQAEAGLAQFQKVYALFTFNANGTISFNYNEGTGGTVVITNPGAIAILKQLQQLNLSNPPTGTDVLSFLNNFWYSTQGTGPSIQQQIMEFFIDTQFTMENNLNNPITNTAVILFYLSLANVPASQTGGVLDKFFLSVGYNDGSLINWGNIYAISAALTAQLQNDSFLDPAVIEAGMNISTKDPLYQFLGSFFTNFYQSAGKINEQAAWEWESRFFPYYDVKKATGFIDALPVSNQTNAEQESEINREFNKEWNRLQAHKTELSHE